MLRDAVVVGRTLSRSMLLAMLIKRQVQISICIHVCASVLIVMVLCLKDFRAPEAPLESS